MIVLKRTHLVQYHNVLVELHFATVEIKLLKQKKSTFSLNSRMRSFERSISLNIPSSLDVKLLPHS